MNITLLCSDEKHPVNDYLEKWMESARKTHRVELVRRKADASGGDILFLISCSEIIEESERERYSACLVLHASDLPKGRGWSPHIWELSRGAESITLSLLEAEDKVDSGRIWKKVNLHVPSHTLWDEINEILFQSEIDLIQFAVDNLADIVPEDQANEELATYYNRRTSKDSEVNPFKSLAEQFDAIRVCDPDRFPAYFDLRGQRYLLKLEKVHEQ